MSEDNRCNRVYDMIKLRENKLTVDKIRMIWINTLTDIGSILCIILYTLTSKNINP